MPARFSKLLDSGSVLLHGFPLSNEQNQFYERIGFGHFLSSYVKKFNFYFVESLRKIRIFLRTINVKTFEAFHHGHLTIEFKGI
jgi:hypothetical protein